MQVDIIALNSVLKDSNILKFFFNSRSAGISKLLLVTNLVHVTHIIGEAISAILKMKLTNLVLSPAT